MRLAMTLPILNDFFVEIMYASFASYISRPPDAIYFITGYELKRSLLNLPVLGVDWFFLSEILIFNS
jgi:hypothetical protein